MPQSATAAGQPTNVPTRKVVAGGLAGAASVIVVFVLNSYVLGPLHLKLITGEVASAITTVLSFVVSYFVSPGSNESVT